MDLSGLSPFLAQDDSIEPNIYYSKLVRNSSYQLYEFLFGELPVFGGGDSFLNLLYLSHPFLYLLLN